MKTEEEKNELRRKAEDLLKKKDYRHAKYLYDDIPDVGMSCFCNYCHQLKTKFEAFLFKEITEEQLRKCISEYSKDIVEEVETIYGSIDDILFREWNEKTYARLSKETSFESFFEMIDYENKLSCWAYSKGKPSFDQLRRVFKENPFNLEFVKKAYTYYYIDEDGDLILTYGYDLHLYIEQRVRSMSDKELEQVVSLDEYIDKLYRDLCVKENIPIENEMDEEVETEDDSYKSLVEKIKSERRN